jgi:very-short-patch-repair endonuclease
VSQYGRWMAAVLRCGPKAVLSHTTAARLWKITAERHSHVELSVPPPVTRRVPGLIAHRRVLTATDVTEHRGIPVTTPICTLIDIAPRLPRATLEAAINEADKRDLTDPERLRASLLPSPGRPGVGVLRELLERQTFLLTDSELERRFLPIARRAGLSVPQTRRWVNGFKVDFYWPRLRLVVETDGLRYHRTPAQQARDRVRDQAHMAAGVTCLRFTHAQVRFEPDHVRSTLKTVRRRCPSISDALSSPGTTQVLTPGRVTLQPPVAAATPSAWSTWSATASPVRPTSSRRSEGLPWVT